MFFRCEEDGNLTVGKEGESDPFMAYTEPEPFPTNYIGVCTGWGATGEWVIECKPFLLSIKLLKLVLRRFSKSLREI